MIMPKPPDSLPATGAMPNLRSPSHSSRPRAPRTCMNLLWLWEETSLAFNLDIRQAINFFNVSAESPFSEYQWANRWLYEHDPYAALLVSKHRTGIWTSRYGLMKQPHYPVRQLSREIEMRVADIHREQEVVAADFDQLKLTTNYILRQIWDLFSLYICRNEHLKEESYDPVRRPTRNAPTFA